VHHSTFSPLSNCTDRRRLSVCMQFWSAPDSAGPELFAPVPGLPAPCSDSGERNAAFVAKSLSPARFASVYGSGIARLALIVLPCGT
jgi:hypothetical protein